MKLHEINYFLSMINENTSVSVIQGDSSFILNEDWEVVVEAPDGHVYQLNKNPWTAKDLVHFMMKYPLENKQCVMMFIYNIPDEYNTLCLIPNEVVIYLENESYEIEFKAFQCC